MATQQKYQTLVFGIHALTNLHPGAGDSFYGAVDKLVQRDPATNRPTVHSHSLKGALREYFEKQTNLGSDFVTYVFGSAIGGSANDASQGNYRFFSADLLALPVPDGDPNSSDAYHLFSAEKVWTDFTRKISLLGGAGWTPGNLQAAVKTTIGVDWKTDAAKFREACDELPVVARNQLNNGISQNLWYEELVPHQTVLGLIVQADMDALRLMEFTQHLDNQVVQLGANATVGYGYCWFKLLSNTTQNAG